MKKSLTRIIPFWGVILFIGVLLGAMLLNNPKAKTESVSANASQADLTFAVLGDVHENTEHLQEALNDLYSINSNMDALVFNGDTVDQGLEEQYKAITKTLQCNQSKLPETIIKNIGNHEFFDYTIEENTPAEVQTFMQRYLDFAGEEKVYHDIWLKNYHFISLGSEDGNSQTNDSIKAYISEKQLQWLKVKLAENYVVGKPIFVFLHQPLNTNPNSGWVGSEQGDILNDILNSYPEVILFTSHTHADLSASSVNLDQAFTKVHTGTIHYTIVRRDPGEIRAREPYIKGLYVEVTHNTVIINGRDFKEKTWIFSQEITQ
ncbi:metallophosphoesterase family protein [Desulfitobacterium sp.]|uniref:metallophosphoesterase family protein n=1 Tax=Desulfitobacterium sp. TaxID=49981 RepID=UPI002B1F309F|nr:metallophosphoesterase [Desulfitobacterium sp.]MEA4902778.1 metallophosphoesterase [Desulfitobacterium sp.]